MEKPILMNRIFVFLKGMKEYCFTLKVQKFTLDTPIEEKDVEVFQVNAKGETVSSYKIPITKEIDLEAEKNFLAMTSLDFHFNFFMRMEQDLSLKERVFAHEKIEEKIYQWIEELDSIQSKVKTEFHNEYRAFYVELWQFYDYVTKSKNPDEIKCVPAIGGQMPPPIIVSYEYCLDIIKIYKQLSKLTFDKKDKVLETVKSSIKHYCTEKKIDFEHYFNNKLALVVPSTIYDFDWYFAFFLMAFDINKIDAFLSFQQKRYEGEHIFLNFVEFPVYRIINDNSPFDNSARLDKIMQWVKEQKQKDKNNYKKPKQNSGGRPISKYVKFSDCLNLKPDEYKKFEKALENELRDGTWTPNDKGDYTSLLEVCEKLKFTKKIEPLPFARAFCFSYNIDFESFSRRLKSNPDRKKYFTNLLSEIRSKSSKQK